VAKRSIQDHRPFAWIGKDGVHAGIAEGDAIVDSEGKFAWEPEGFFLFVFWPRRCRNGRLRWFCTLERHSDGTYTKPSDQSW
jgi:hypothetical protein